MRISDWRSDVCSSDRRGEFQWLHDRGAVEFSPAGTPARMSGVIRLITLRKQQEERLEYLANFDDLTGHFNKVRLRDALEHALAQSQRFGQTGVYVVIGVDHLDRINTRSEEHTSELPYLMRISNAVFCLKKKTII